MEIDTGTLSSEIDPMKPPGLPTSRRRLFGLAGAAALGAGGASLFATAPAGASTTDYLPVVDVTDPTYGADPTGTTDSTTAINSAVAALPSQGGVVYFPAGTYKISSPIVIGNGGGSALSTRYGVTLLGQGESGQYSWGFPSTVLKWSGPTNTGPVYNSSLILISGPLEGWSVQSMSLWGGGAGATANYGIYNLGGCKGWVRNVEITGCRFGVMHQAAYLSGNPTAAVSNIIFCNYENVEVFIPTPASGNELAGMYFESDSSANHKDNFYCTFRNVNIWMPTGSVQCWAYGFYIKGMDNCRFSECSVNGLPNLTGSAAGWGIYFDYSYASSSNPVPTEVCFSQINLDSTGAANGAIIGYGNGTPGYCRNRIEMCNLETNPGIPGVMFANHSGSMGMATWSAGSAIGSPGSGDGEMRLYKGSAGNTYLLVSFNDGGTLKYRYMNLHSTNATWSYSTSLPT
jgi:Pectate lyase superfamily protein